VYNLIYRNSYILDWNNKNLYTKLKKEINVGMSNKYRLESILRFIFWYNLLQIWEAILTLFLSELLGFSLLQFRYFHFVLCKITLYKIWITSRNKNIKVSYFSDMHLLRLSRYSSRKIAARYSALFDTLDFSYLRFSAYTNHILSDARASVE